MLWLEKSPSYFRFYNRTIKLEELPDGTVEGKKLNTRTGLFEPTSFDDVYKVLGGSADFDLFSLSEDEFVRETEEARSRYLQGEGSVFDIYRRVAELFDNAKLEGRRVGSAELEYIYSLWRQSFHIWEDESARLAAGEPPSFRYGRIGSG